MNRLNESDVTKVTCVTNVTNEFDETRFLSFMQSDSAAIEGALYFIEASKAQV